MLIKILLGLLVLVVVLAIVAATRPDDYTVVRSTRIAAPGTAITPLLEDFHRWESWSPWEKLDPHMTREFSGPTAGPGAAYRWRGNGKVGEGTMKVLGVQPGRQVDVELVFLQPFASENRTVFDVLPEGDGSRVSWTLHGSKGGFPGKFMGLFMNFDRMVGKDFERGLAQLKAAVEAGPTASAKAP